AVGTIGFAGMFCAMAGVVLASISNPEPHQRLSVEVQAHRASIILAILAAIGFGAFFTLFHTGVFDMLANILYGEASVTGLLSLTSMVSSLYPVITVMLARFVLLERLGGLQQTGVGLALVGTVLISLK
ncbi:MAG: hypothetical protein EBT47_08760, partial [Chloroflexi bacterium]|nr:hypothetical protein [Chloroflexota bacterium]